MLVFVCNVRKCRKKTKPRGYRHVIERDLHDREQPKTKIKKEKRERENDRGIRDPLNGAKWK